MATSITINKTKIKISSKCSAAAQNMWNSQLDSQPWIWVQTLCKTVCGKKTQNHVGEGLWAIFKDDTTLKAWWVRTMMQLWAFGSTWGTPSQSAFRMKLSKPPLTAALFCTCVGGGGQRLVSSQPDVICSPGRSQMTGTSLPLCPGWCN